MTRRRRALDSVGLGTNSLAREFTPGKEERAGRGAQITDRRSSEPMGAQGQRRKTDPERPLVEFSRSEAN